MNAAQRDLFRQALLRVLEANPSRFGLGLTSLQLHIGAFGFMAPALNDLLAELHILQEKGYVDLGKPGLNEQLKTWRINAQGLEHLAQLG